MSMPLREIPARGLVPRCPTPGPSHTPKVSAQPSPSPPPTPTSPASSRRSVRRQPGRTTGSHNKRASSISSVPPSPTVSRRNFSLPGSGQAPAALSDDSLVTPAPGELKSAKRRGQVAEEASTRLPAHPTQSHTRQLPSFSTTRSFQLSISQEEAKPPWDSELELRRTSRVLLRLQKYGLLLAFFAINGIGIWAVVLFHEHWYIFLPFLAANTFAQVVFALCIVVSACYTKLGRLVGWKQDGVPGVPESFVMVLPCYNEDRTEIETSLKSLINQNRIDQHPRLIMIIVDGNAKAPGESVSTQDFLLNEMFARDERQDFANGYSARDGFFMPITIQHGFYQGLPYVVVGKKYNQGKRDSLCFVRSFLYHYTNRSESVETMFNQEVFNYLGSILTDHGLHHVDYLCGMDGDTVFEENCIFEMIKEMRRGGPNVVGVCGAVLVKFDEKPWGWWNLMQNTEYNLTQGLRREFQSRVSGKVNCLPGCCQLIRVQAATFGDDVLRQRFGHVPKPNDTVTQHIMGVYSEDSIHASIIFSQHPKSQTRQALKARAYTTAPQSWPVFLSQRKRWALGSKSNEFVMVFRPGIIWIERVCSFITVVTWWIGPFVVAAMINFGVALARQGKRLFENKLMIGLMSVLAFRYLYSFMIITWFPHTWIARLRFLVGFFMYLVLSPWMNAIITVYALFHCDEFSWGKTRASEGDEDGHGGLLPASEPNGKEQRLAEKTPPI